MMRASLLITITISACFTQVAGKGYTDPLYKAIDRGNFARVKRLVQRGANVNKIKVDGHDSAPLAWACANGQFKIAYYLLKKGANPNGGTTYDTALWWLSYQLNKGYSKNKSYKLAKYMLDHGAKVDFLQKPWNNGTALMAAAGNNSRKLVDLYLKYGADRKIKHDGRTAADYAESAGHIELANYLRGKNSIDYKKSLIYLVRKGDLKQVERLVNKQSTLTKKKNLINKVEKKSNRTSLHYAIKEGHTKIAKYLIDNGADIHKESNGSFTPLHVAAAYYRSEIALYLIKKGAKVNIVQSSGCATGFTSLSWAITNSMYKVTRAMLKAGGDPSLPRQHALISARRNFKMVKLLVEEGDVRPTDRVLEFFKKEANKYDRKYKYYYDSVRKIYKYLKVRKGDMPPPPNDGLVLNSRGPDREPINPKAFNKKALQDAFEPIDIRDLRSMPKRRR